jgi:hypothetical protein
VTSKRLRTPSYDPDPPNVLPRCDADVLSATDNLRAWRRNAQKEKYGVYKSGRPMQCTRAGVVLLDGRPLCARHAGIVALARVLGEREPTLRDGDNGP